MEALFALVYSLVLMVVGTIVRGLALVVLWRWFMVPFGLPELGAAWAIGVGMTMSYLLGIEAKADGTKDESLASILFTATLKVLLTPAFVLLLGYIVHSYMH